MAQNREIEKKFEEASFDEILAETHKVAGARSRMTWIFAIVVAIYTAITFIQFDIPSAIRKYNPDRVSKLVLDSYAYKWHIDMRWNKPERKEIKLEGNRRNMYKGDDLPAWINDNAAGGREVLFDNGGKMVIYDERVEMLDWPGAPQDFTFTRGENNKPYVVGFKDNPEDLPDWIRVTASKIEVRPSLFEYLQVYRSKVEIHRYSVGWEQFWFDFQSPLRDYGLFQAVGTVFSGERIVPDKSNAWLIATEVWDNDIWFHGHVIFLMVQTLFMALLGTLLASAVALPLAFLSAYNVTPFMPLRFALRRFYDFLRGIDMLIWSLILLRAFGPGMFTGIFAIALTDTGTLGKLMSEAIENGEEKQQEGVRSTGASTVQRHRFGLIPQILPVFISQSLYYLESNTRGAVLIGAMGAGGIGLHFLGAVNTGTSWEVVAYLSLLILILVIGMDMISSRLRRILIGSDEQKH